MISEYEDKVGAKICRNHCPHKECNDNRMILHALAIEKEFIRLEFPKTLDVKKKYSNIDIANLLTKFLTYEGD